MNYGVEAVGGILMVLIYLAVIGYALYLFKRFVEAVERLSDRFAEK